QVFHDVVPLPDGEGAAVGRCLEFADGGVVDADGLGEVADQGPEELLAGADGGPFDHRPEGVQVVGDRGGRRPAHAGGGRARVGGKGAVGGEEGGGGGQHPAARVPDPPPAGAAGGRRLS